LRLGLSIAQTSCYIARVTLCAHIIPLPSPFLSIARPQPPPRNNCFKDYRPDDGLFCNIVGGVISPLPANIYLHPLDVSMRDAGYEMVRYADDCAPGEGVHEMRVGPSQPVCGGRLQTTLSGGGQEPRVVSVKEKAWLDRVR
jgi:hypothetical protein